MKKKIFLVTVAFLSIVLLACSLNFINVAKADAIFSDSFQSGNLSAWTEFRGTLYINSQTTNNGQPYSAQSIMSGSIQGNLYYHTLSSVTNPIYVREYVYINSTTDPSTNGDYYEVGGFSASDGPNYGDGEICVINVAGTPYWGVYYRDLSSPTGFSFSISSSNSTSDAHPVTIGWNCVELRSFTGGTGQQNGEEQLYLNGALIIDAKNVSNDDRTPYNVIIGGSQHVTNPSETWNYYIDDVAVSSSYIGPIQNQLTMQTNYGTVSPANGTYDEASIQIIAAVPPTAGSGERYVWLGWTGSGVGSYTGSDNPASVTMNGNITETASWKYQYNLTVTSAYGSPNPSSGWFDNGSSITESVASPVSGGSGTQYVCTGWSGTGSVPASGSASALTFTINAPSNITWNWKTQYYLTVTSANGTTGGDNWYDNGTPAYATVTPLTVAGTTGTQYVFTGWGGDASGTTSPSNAITMDGPKTATANWQTQYNLTVSSVHGTTIGTGWYNASTSAYASTQSVVAGATGTQYVFTGWSGDASGTTSPSNAITMDGPKTATANWQTQYNLTFAQSGVGSDFSGNFITVNGTNYGRAGFTTWANASDIYTFSYVGSPLVVTPNAKQYLLTGVSGNSTTSSLTVSQPTTITGAYKTQYYLTVASAYDSPSPSSGWFDSGSSISGFVASPVSGGTGVQYVCTGWSGTGSVPASGIASAVTFTISAPSNITWNWKTQYLVSFAISPSGAATTNPSGTNLWEDPGTYPISATPYYGYSFSSWSTDTGNITFGYATGGSTTATISGPGTITANLATVPTPTPTPTPIHTPTPSASPSPSPSPTLSPSQSPTTSPSPSPSQSSSAVNNIGTYAVVGVVVVLILGGVVAAVIAIRKRNKTSPFQ